MCQCDLIQHVRRQLGTFNTRTHFLTASRHCTQIVRIERFDTRAQRRLTLEGLNESLEGASLHDESRRDLDACPLQLAEAAPLTAYVRSVIEPNIREPANDVG
jgi:hypothetical protein